MATLETGFFIAGTWDGANWNLYRNGKLVRTGGRFPPVRRWWTTLRGPWGARTAPDQYLGLWFSGTIDEPAIFDHALSSSQISTMYQAALVPPVITTKLVSPGTVYEGSSVSFPPCGAEGNPTLKYIWVEGRARRYQRRRATWRWSGVTVASSGVYSVIVSNAYGTATSSAPLTVVASSPVIVTQAVFQSFVGLVSLFQLLHGSGRDPSRSRISGNGPSGVVGGSTPGYTNVASAGPGGIVLCLPAKHALAQPTRKPILLE